MGRYGALLQTDRTPERRMGIAGGKGKVAGPALGIETIRYRDRFNQRGFAGAVFPNKKSDRRSKNQPAAVYRGQPSQIAARRNRRAVHRNTPDKKPVHLTTSSETLYRLHAIF